MSERGHLVSIWFFIGALLAVYGVLILGAGIYNFFSPAEGVVLGRLHAGIWWGAILLLLGGFYTWRFFPGRP